MSGEDEHFIGTSAPLKSISFSFGEYCRTQSENFVRCKESNQHPSQCVEDGNKVTVCAMELFAKVREKCNPEFVGHWECLDSNNQEFRFCRPQQLAFDTCMLENFGLGKDRYEELKSGKLPSHKPYTK